MRLFVLLYGLVTYVIFLASFLYAVGFVGNFIVPKGIDDGPAGDPTASVLVDMALMTLFAVQHSVMARPAFKRWWTRIIPAAIERSTYVLATSLILFLLFWQWRPLPGIVWAASHPVLCGVLWGLFGLGWLIVLASTFMLNHFELFGLRQVWLFWSGRPHTSLPFRTPFLYRVVRHPIMLGFIIAFWATPTMTQGHLLFAAVVTAYVLVALQLEERDLVVHLGEDYSAYKRRVPMLIPIPGRSAEERKG